MKFQYDIKEENYQFFKPLSLTGHSGFEAGRGAIVFGAPQAMIGGHVMGRGRHGPDHIKHGVVALVRDAGMKEPTAGAPGARASTENVRETIKL